MGTFVAGSVDAEEGQRKKTSQQRVRDAFEELQAVRTDTELQQVSIRLRRSVAELKAETAARHGALLEVLCAAKDCAAEHAANKATPCRCSLCLAVERALAFPSLDDGQ